MAQEKILFNGIAIKQPDSGDFESSFETTYTEDSGRPINGVLHIRLVRQLSSSNNKINLSASPLFKKPLTGDLSSSFL